MPSKKDTLESLVRPVVEGLGYECWGMEFFPQGKRPVLRIYIESQQASANVWGKSVDAQQEERERAPEQDEDSSHKHEKESGIGVEDCEKVSRQVSGVLDVEDPIAGDYVLEVSSPGLDRRLYKLSHYARFAGHTIELMLRVAFEGQRKFTGLLNGIEGDEVRLVVGDGEFLFPIESIEKAKVVPQYD